jgi:hypothetical protein
VSRENFDRVLKRAEKREIDEEFTRLCIDRLKKSHNAETLAVAKEKHQNYFEEIQKERLDLPKTTKNVPAKLVMKKAAANNFSFMARKSPRDTAAALRALPPKAPAFSAKKTALQSQYPEDEDNISINLSEQEAATPRAPRRGGQTVAGLGQRSQLSVKSSALAF